MPVEFVGPELRVGTDQVVHLEPPRRGLLDEVIRVQASKAPARAGQITVQQRRDSAGVDLRTGVRAEQSEQALLVFG